MNTLGRYIRDLREALKAGDARYSLNKVAERVGVTPAFLSQLERDRVQSGPSEDTLRRLATEIGADPDLLLAMAGKVSADLQEVIRRRPQLFAALLRELREAPDHTVLRIVREVRDGEW
jgi:HTH-type transcriptional regulator, competence development regulator